MAAARHGRRFVASSAERRTSFPARRSGSHPAVEHFAQIVSDHKILYREAYSIGYHPAKTPAATTPESASTPFSYAEKTGPGRRATAPAFTHWPDAHACCRAHRLPACSGAPAGRLRLRRRCGASNCAEAAAPAVSFCGTAGTWRPLCGRLPGGRLHDVDAATEHGAILDDNARRGEIAFERSSLANFHLIAGAHVAAQPAQNGDRARLHVGVHVAVGADRQIVVLQLDRALDLAVDAEDLRCR